MRPTSRIYHSRPADLVIGCIAVGLENAFELSQEPLRPVAEQEQAPAQRVTRQTIADEPVQSLEPLAHIGDSRGQIDPRRWTQSKHGLRPLEDSQQAFESTRIKIRMYLDPAPARQHHGQPTTGFVLLRRIPGRQLHRHQTTGRGDWLTSSLPTQFL
jgi:hypothetical protein